MKAYILVQTTVGRSSDVSRQISEMPGVVSCDDVTGPHDVVVMVETADVDELGRLVAERIQQVPGITRTVTCPVVHL